MNASGAPTPNIPPAGNYYAPNNSSSGGNINTSSNSNSYGNYSSSGNSGGGNQNYSSSGSSSQHYPSNRQSSGNTMYDSSTNYSSNKSSGQQSMGSIGVGQQLTDEESLGQLLSWVNMHMPAMTKPSLAIYNEKNMSAKQRFDSITGLLSKGSR